MDTYIWEVRFHRPRKVLKSGGQTPGVVCPSAVQRPLKLKAFHFSLWIFNGEAKFTFFSVFCKLLINVSVSLNGEDPFSSVLW